MDHQVLEWTHLHMALQAEAKCAAAAVLAQQDRRVYQGMMAHQALMECQAMTVHQAVTLHQLQSQDQAISASTVNLDHQDHQAPQDRKDHLDPQARPEEEAEQHSQDHQDRQAQGGLQAQPERWDPQDRQDLLAKSPKEKDLQAHLDQLEPWDHLDPWVFLDRADDPILAPLDRWEIWDHLGQMDALDLQVPQEKWDLLAKVAAVITARLHGQHLAIEIS